MDNDKPSGVIVNVPVSKIQASPFQSRRVFQPERLQELADSIRINRLIQPIVVRRISEDLYELIAGERRWRAHKLINWETIDSYLIEATDEEAHAMVLIENIQREDLTITEQARDLVALLEFYGGNKQAVCVKVGKGEKYVADRLLVPEQPREIQNLLDEDKITLAHLRIISEAKDDKVKLEMANSAARMKLSEKQLRGRFQKFLTPKETRPSAGTNSVKVEALGRSLILTYEMLEKFEYDMLRDPKRRATLQKQVAIMKEAIRNAEEKLTRPVEGGLEVVRADKVAAG